VAPVGEPVDELELETSGELVGTVFVGSVMAITFGKKLCAVKIFISHSRFVVRTVLQLRKSVAEGMNGHQTYKKADSQ
jgi:hypothetical protein